MLDRENKKPQFSTTHIIYCIELESLVGIKALFTRPNRQEIGSLAKHIQFESRSFEGT